MQRQLVLSTALVCGATLVSACTKRPEQPVDVQPSELDLDGALVEIAKVLPEFGGLYIDESGTLIVRMVGADTEPQDPEKRDTRIHRALSAVLGPDYIEQSDAMAPGSEYGFRVVDAEYRVTQLSPWRRAADRTLAMDGVVLTDLDERRNRVIIGVESLEMRAQVERSLRAENVPLDAVIIEAVDPIYLKASLRSNIRPVDGGVQIESDTGVFGFSLCTLGFNASFDDRPGFVTNSHCTGQNGGGSGTDFHQPTDPFNPFADQQKIGDEHFDPAFFTGSICPAGRVCKRSDAAFVEYDSTRFTSTEIARTSLWTGSLTIDDRNPAFRIVGEQLFPLSGVTLDKVGRTTGWTNGTVNRTCFSTGVAGLPNVTMLCQYDVVRPAGRGQIVDSGDSGSPVFRTGEGNEVELFGILWGGPADNSSFVFSSILFVHLDLFPLTVELHQDDGGSPPPPRPLGCELDEKCCERAPNGDCDLCIPRTAACP